VGADWHTSWSKTSNTKLFAETNGMASKVGAKVNKTLGANHSVSMSGALKTAGPWQSGLNQCASLPLAMDYRYRFNDVWTG
jgi:hypothetical protein